MWIFPMWPPIDTRAYYTLTDLGVTATSLATAFGSGKYAQKIANGIVSHYTYRWAGYIVNDITDDKIADLKERVLHKLTDRYNLTVDRYSVLFDSYTTISNDLLSGLKTNSTSRFNDTPQGGSDWSPESDDHLTSATVLDTYTDYEPVMAKVARIQDDYQNTLKDWVTEFDNLFGGEIYD